MEVLSDDALDFLIESSKNSGDVQDYDREVLRQGVIEELENVDDPAAAMDIVIGHLKEEPDFYTVKKGDDEEEEEDCEVPCHHRHPEITTWFIPLYIGLGVLFYLYFKKANSTQA